MKILSKATIFFCAVLLFIVNYVHVEAYENQDSEETNITTIIVDSSNLGNNVEKYVNDSTIEPKASLNDLEQTSLEPKIESVTKQPITYIDEPSRKLNNENVKVSGWALNGSGVKEIKVYINGIYMGSAITGKSRPDVNAAYPGYPGGANSGYELIIDRIKVLPGVHTLKIESIGEDGSKNYSEKQIEMIKPKAMTYIDEPSRKLNNENIKVAGWALNPSGVKEIKVYIDGIYMGSTSTTNPRPDVNAAFTGYPGGANSGYELIIDKSKVLSGVHTLKIESIGEDGSKNYSEKQIEITKPKAMTYIDEPSRKLNNENIKVAGWALNPSGVKEIKVYIDGIYMGSTIATNPRPDVNAAFPGYPGGANSGYELVIDKNKVAPGVHTLKIESIGQDGSKNYSEKQIEITKPKAMTYIDEPSRKLNDENIKVAGWALNPSGVKEIKVYIDGIYMGSTIATNPRPDVNTAYPGYPGGLNSGYELTIDKNKVSLGKHILKIEVIGQDGSKTYSEKEIEIIKPEPITWIDRGPGVYKNEDIQIEGWALNPAGVKKVEVYLWDEFEYEYKYLGDALYGASRPDVNQAFPGYVNGENSGFSFSVWKSNLTQGENNILIKVIGNDNSVNTEVINIKYYERTVVVIDPGHGGRDPGAVLKDSYGNVLFNEKDLNLDIALATAKYLRDNNIDVILTRETDKTVELSERSSLSNSIMPSLFVSIHNDTPIGNGDGTHIICGLEDKYGGPSKTLATNIMDSVVSNTEQNRGSRGIWTREGENGDYYHVIRAVEAPSVIVECSYMNTNDIKVVDTLEERIQMGIAIAKGILKTLNII